MEHLHRSRVRPDEVEILEVYRERESPIDARFLATPEREWLFRPDLCRVFETRYAGHIQEKTCSFRDRDRRGFGP